MVGCVPLCRQRLDDAKMENDLDRQIDELKQQLTELNRVQKEHIYITPSDLSSIDGLHEKMTQKAVIQTPSETTMELVSKVRSSMPVHLRLNLTDDPHLMTTLKHDKRLDRTWVWIFARTISMVVDHLC